MQKQEVMDTEERNDSGINSGSDFISSSPGSDHSDNFNIQVSSPLYNHSMKAMSTYYSTPVMRSPHSVYQQQSLPSHMAHSPNRTVFASEQEPLSQMPTSKEIDDHSPNVIDDPLRRLQMSLEKGGFLPQSLSPKPSEGSAEDETRSDNDIDEYDEQGLRIPKVNSHGKVKTFKCKQCDFVAITKLDFWEHTKGHIKEDKRLTCPKCPFVTEYKHHLEYHLRNHVGSKPFKCSQCSYSCVNKSMLNSHLKSHSNVYQYRCADCSYATKYCHSLKLHLRKYSHKPAMVLNPDGTPNPLPIIDIYGTRRGPKVKNQDHKPVSGELSPKPEQMLPFPLSQFMLNTQPQLPFNGFPFFALPNPLLLKNLEKLAMERQGSPAAMEQMAVEPQTDANEGEVLDLSKRDEVSQKSRRKGQAYKLAQVDENSSEDDEEATTTMFSNVEVVEVKSTEKYPEPINNNNNNHKDENSCQYCNINFGDPVLYTMHMGYHGYKNPFTCNMCGEECKDHVSFFLHIARTPHS